MINFSSKAGKYIYIFPVNVKQKRAELATLLSFKLDFKSQTGVEEGDYIITKGLVNHEDKTTVNTYTPQKTEHLNILNK